jgi:hypothetical protein
VRRLHVPTTVRDTIALAYCACADNVMPEALRRVPPRARRAV